MAERQIREMTGRVYKAKMDKTIVVEISRRVQDSHYRKYISKRSRFKAHDEKNECKEGDIVTIRETKPISKEKSWVLAKIVRSAVEV
jgi:small subunit ribosomal protein S17